MRILAIGNSYSQDATRYLHDIAKADGVELEVVNLYIGGCSLERHYRNMLSGEPAYNLQFDGHMTGFFVSIDDALLSRQWDVVTIQQVSYGAPDPETYRPYAEAIAEHIRECQPKAKLLMHQTWFYEEGSERLKNVAKYDSAAAMLADIKTAYTQIAAELKADGIIPAGELMFSLTNRIAQTGIDCFLSDANGLHCLLDGEGGACCGHLGQADFCTFCDILGITNVVPRRNGLGVTGNTLKGGVNLGIRGDLCQCFDFCGDHITHNFGVNHLGHSSNCHSKFILSYLLFIALWYASGFSLKIFIRSA